MALFEAMARATAKDASLEINSLLNWERDFLLLFFFGGGSIWQLSFDRNAIIGNLTYPNFSQPTLIQPSHNLIQPYF